MNMNTLKTLVATSLSLVCLASLRAEITGQWDFENDLSATVGNDLEYFDFVDGPTEQETKFGTTADFGIPDINGQPANVMKMPKNDATMGYLMLPDLPANGGGQLCNQWSLVMDLLYPTDSSGKVRAIIQIDDPFGNSNGAEVTIGANNAVGNAQPQGSIHPDTWHRLVIAVDQSADPPTMIKYIDGIKVGEEILPIGNLGKLDGRWAILDKDFTFGGDFALLFSDSTGSSEVGYVGSIQIHDKALSSGYVAAMGVPTAGGIPTDVKAVAGIERISPSPGQILVFPETPIEVNLLDGDKPIPQNSIKLSVDGQEVTSQITSPNPGEHHINYDPGLLEPGSVVTAKLSFIDPSNNNGENITEWSFTIAPYNLSPLDLTVDSLLYLRFEEATALDGDQIEDHSPSENHGTLFLGEESGDRKVDGIIGKGIDFTPIPADSHNRVETTNPYDAIPNSYSCWVKIDENSSDGRLGVTLGNWPSPRNINWEVHQRGRPRIYWNNGEVDWKVEGHDLRTGKWEHFAFVRDPSKNLFSFYRNGVLAATLTANSTDVIPETPPMAGADYRGSGQTFKAQLDEVVVFNKVLTPTEVFRIYAHAFEFPEYQFPTPPIISVSPLEDDYNIPPGSTVEVVIDESTSQNQVDQASIVLLVNDEAVTPTVSKENDQVYVRYTPAAGFDLESTVTMKVTYADTGGIETSKTWSFLTAPEPTIERQPESISVVVGSATSFSVSAKTISPVNYQWRFNGNPIPDATGRTLVLVNIQLGEAGDYDVVITDVGGTVTSIPATLSVLADVLPQNPEDSLAVGMSAAWPFDVDFGSHIPGFDGSPINGASISTDAKVGSGAVSVSQAEEQYVDVDSQVIIDGALSYSVAGWFKVTGGTGRRFLWETSPSNWAISAEVTPGGNVKAFAKLADASSHGADTGIQPAIDEWHHVAVTFDGGAGLGAVYYDGEKVAVDFAPPFPPGVGTAVTEGFHIGSYRGGNGRFFNGLIDDVGVWTRVLNESEISYLADGNAIPKPDPTKSIVQGLKASWHFDGDFKSLSSQFDGVPINGASISTDAKVGSGAVSVSQAEEQYVDVDSQVIADGAFTYSVAGWFKVTGGTGRRFLWETSPSNWAISAEVTPGGNVKAFAKLADASSHSADTGIQPALDEWHHVAVTFDGGAGLGAVYYDGEKVAVDFAPPFPPGVGTAVTEGFHIGSYRGGNGRFFNGLIDDVGVWDRVLSELEIGYLAGGNPIPDPDPAKTLLGGQKATWHFDGDFTATTQGFDGVPINGASICDRRQSGIRFEPFPSVRQRNNMLMSTGR